MPKVLGIPGPYTFFFTASTVTRPCTSTFVATGSMQSSGWRRSNLRGIMGSALGNSTCSVALLGSTNGHSLRPGMSTAVSAEARIKNVEVTDEIITAHLVDDRSISVPLAWSWRLSEATVAQRKNWHLIGDGHGVNWPDIDEDLSAAGMLNGIPARRPKRSAEPGPTRSTVARVRERPPKYNSPPKRRK